LPSGSLQWVIPNQAAVTGSINFGQAQPIQNVGAISFGQSQVTSLTGAVRSISGDPRNYGYSVSESSVNSPPGGAFYRDQEGPEYSPVIMGKFSNK
jgi:hypothetical protein